MKTTKRMTTLKDKNGGVYLLALSGPDLRDQLRHYRARAEVLRSFAAGPNLWNYRGCFSQALRLEAKIKKHNDRLGVPVAIRA